MDGRTLFRRRDGVSQQQYEFDNLNRLAVTFMNAVINKAYIGIYPKALKAVVNAIPRKLAGIDKPGPFKKAAALTLALVENRPFYYVLYDLDSQPALPQWEHELRVVAALGIARLYLTTTLPAWLGKPKTVIKAPSPVSGHFIRDFRAFISYRYKTIDVRMLSMIWELMTYMSNKRMPEGPEKDCGLPGVSL